MRGTVFFFYSNILKFVFFLFINDILTLLKGGCLIYIYSYVDICMKLNYEQN